MLTNQLRQLEHDGLIARKIYPEVPPKVEYTITEFGRTLEPVLLTLTLWAKEHMLPRMDPKCIAPPEDRPIVEMAHHQPDVNAPTKTQTQALAEPAPRDA